MSCYHPSYICKNVNPKTGEVTHKFVGSRIAEHMKKDLLYRDYSGSKSSFGDVYDFNLGDSLSKYIQIPCGKCIGCRIDYKRSWADRLTYHAIGKEGLSWFVTLTYDDEHLEHLPRSNVPNVFSLNFDDCSDFIKMLRNKFRSSHIDFYASGEYGTSEMRPHFHLILFNVPLNDLEFWKVNDTGVPIYISNLILDCWRGRGFATVQEFSWTSAAYTANYVEKKLNGAAAAEYDAYGLFPEKSRCSRRPGIAHEYYLENYEDIWKNNGLSVGRDVNSSGHLGIPRYFRKLACDCGIGYDAFLKYNNDTIDRSNLLNPLKFDTSSFDLSRVQEMLRFEEREVLSTLKHKKI